MTVEEFSNKFTTLLNEYSATAAFGNDVSMQDIRVDEYEKSEFLTKAQEQLVLACYNGNNSAGEAFEQTEEQRRYLADLVKTETLSPIGTDTPTGLSSSSYFFTLPEKLWFIIYEGAKISSSDCHNGQMLDGIPVTHDEYNRIRRNPYRGANSRRVLRLDLEGKVIEVISEYTVSSYFIRYVAEPEPIVLIDLPDNLSVNGVSIAQTCKLHEALHEKILEMAVGMAIASRVKGNSSNAK